MFGDKGIYLDLIIINVTGYYKGLNYNPGDKFNDINHEYNVIKFNYIWYPVDATWGSGYIINDIIIFIQNNFFLYFV